jgi:Replication factor RFC1 C terminal domain
MQVIAKAADAFSAADLANTRIRTHQAWHLAPHAAVLGAVYPASYMRCAPGCAMCQCAAHSTASRRVTLVLLLAFSLAALLPSVASCCCAYIMPSLPHCIMKTPHATRKRITGHASRRGPRTTFHPGEMNFPRFTAWLGNNSSARKQARIVGELNTKLLAAGVVCDRRNLRLQYLPALRGALTRPLATQGADGIDEVVALMQAYLISRCAARCARVSDACACGGSLHTKATRSSQPEHSTRTRWHAACGLASAEAVTSVSSCSAHSSVRDALTGTCVRLQGRFRRDSGRHQVQDDCHLGR